MAHLSANILVDGEETNLFDRYPFQCRDELIPRVRAKMWRLNNDGHELTVTRDTPFKIFTSNPRVIDWDGMLGINATSPLASPFLLRFYIGRVRNGYKYQQLEDALRKTSEEGIELPDIATAWNLNNDRYGSGGLGLGSILKTVRGGWDYSPVDHARIFPPSRFI